MATEIQDDYLDCGAYTSNVSNKSQSYPGFITFEQNGDHYFAWVNGDQIVMRSEAYPDADKMERGIKAILKNCDLPERYAVIEAEGGHILVMYGGGDHQAHTGNFEKHSEIGRSCPHNSREALNTLLQFKGNDFANKVVPIANESTSTNPETSNIATGVTAAAVAGATALTSNISEAATSNITEAASSVANETKVAAAAAVATAAAAVSGSITDAKETVATATTKVSNIASNVSENVSSFAGNTSDVVGGATSGGGLGWLKWLVPVLIGVGGYFLWKNYSAKTNATEVTSTETNVAGDTSKVTAALPKVTIDTTTGVVNYDLGAATELDLGNGVKLTNIAKDGFENTLYNFIKSGKIDTLNKKANWFNLHDVQFVTNKTVYATPKAMMQIKNTAAVLKAYPNVILKLGGYTDISGDPIKNKDLSDRRAKQVMKDLIANGAAANQIKEAVGYGSEFAEAKLGDKDGMARDRKTAAKVASM
jgi:outer membrane protein OmpA-like peptidoglycan-associated protein